MKKPRAHIRQIIPALLFCFLAAFSLGFAAQATASDADASQTASSALSHPEPQKKEPALPEGPDEKQVPILMYHSLTDDLGQVKEMQVSTGIFHAQMRTLHAQGYETVTYQQLYDFVVNGGSLPDKPVVITFDDGYQNNLTLGAPILKSFDFCAEIAVIGCSAGKTMYKNTNLPICPHFSMEEAKPWVESGTIHLHSHSYDMHRFPPLDGPQCREGVLPFPDEDEHTYFSLLSSDLLASQMVLSQAGIKEEDAAAFTYPYGYYSDVTEASLKKLGVAVTVTTKPGIARIVRGEEDSLRLLPRFDMEDNTLPLKLLKLLSGDEPR